MMVGERSSFIGNIPARRCGARFRRRAFPGAKVIGISVSARPPYLPQLLVVGAFMDSAHLELKCVFVLLGKQLGLLLVRG